MKPWNLLPPVLGALHTCWKKISGWSAIAKTPHLAAACADHALAQAVAEHKSVFFVEKDATGNKIDYFAATSGQLQLIPAGESLAALEKDYAAMLEDGLLALNQPSFADIIEQCRAIQHEANRQPR